MDMKENMEYTIVHNLANHEYEFIVKNQFSNWILNGNDEMNKSVVCYRMTERIDRISLNDQFSHINEIKYEDGEKRTYSITQLALKVKDQVYKIINESWVNNETTKITLLDKISNIVVRVKGEANIPYHSSLDKYGLKWPIYVYPKGAKSKITLFSGLYNTIFNEFHINNIKLASPGYIEFRKSLQYYFWEDYQVPYDIVNAWYDPLENTITIPVAITAIPLFRNLHHIDDATIGVILGHEVGHSVDNNGRLFDFLGNYVFNNLATEDDDGLWSKNDYLKINETIRCMANDYGHPCGDDEYGYHTIGEDIADQMGVRSGLSMLKDNILTVYDSQYLPLVNVTQSTILKQFFVNYATLWCGRSSITSQCEQVKKDPHALSKHRVNKTLKQIKEFLDVFKCTQNSDMFKNQSDMCLIY
jgi:hypothetical protein